MEKTKIILAVVAVTGLVALTVGLSFAHFIGTPTTTPSGSLQETFEDDWWTEMRAYMQARWSGVEDEEWFNEMIQYMEDHHIEIQNQPWFEDMIEYMEERGYYQNGYRGYNGGYFGPRRYDRRGFGCWGW